MKKTLSMLCVVLVVGFAGTAFAGKKAKVDVCHNGSVYIGDTGDGAVYDPEAWEPGYFVINISGRAVTKHVVNHGDSTTYSVEGLPLVTTEVTEGDDATGAGNVIITGFEMQASCEVITPVPE
jgi:hypothetical protein